MLPLAAPCCFYVFFNAFFQKTPQNATFNGICERFLKFSRYLCTINIYYLSEIVIFATNIKYLLSV